MATILGMRGTGDAGTDERPKSYRETIFYLEKNGTAPLTALMTKMRHEMLTDSEHHWWTKAEPTVRTTHTSPLTASGVPAVVTLTVGSTTGFRPNDVIRCSNTGETAWVVSILTATTMSVVRALGGSGGTALTAGNEWIVAGAASSEGAAVRSAKYSDPVKQYTFLQIFRHPAEVTGTMDATKFRTGSAYKNALREAFRQHNMEREHAFFWGNAYEGTDTGLGFTTSKPTRFTGGVFGNSPSGTPYVPTANRFTPDAGKLTEALLDSYLEIIMAEGSRERIAYCGPSAMRVLSAIAKSSATINMTPVKNGVYGMHLTEWITPFGSLYLKLHPLFAESTVLTGVMAIVEPRNLSYLYMKDRDTKLLKDRQNPGVDGRVDEYLSECGLEIKHGSTHGLISGITGFA